MKILYFDDFKLGVLKGDAVVDVSAEVHDIPRTCPGDLMNGLIERWGSYKPRLDAAGGAGARGAGVPPPPPPRRCRARARATAWRSTTWRTAPAARRRRSTPSTN